VSLKLTLIMLLVLALPGCTGRVSDTFRRVLSAISLMEESSLVVVSNSTTESQPACSVGNRVTIQRSFPAGRTAYCRDKSVLSPEVRQGLTCPGGANIVPFAVSDAVKPCSELTICGVAIAGAKAVSNKADGGTIDELLFTNLPWGCNAVVEYSFDSAFPREATGTLSFPVQAPECPYCPRQNRTTCLPCSDLTADEDIISGQVITRTCAGGTCRSCPVIGDATQTVAHGQGKVYYSDEVSTCGQKCNMMSLRRVCNDGLWEGNPSFNRHQCVDTSCGCTFPGESVTYAHNTSKTIYKSTSPACGVECAAEEMLVRCNDSRWETGTPARFLSAAELAVYPARSCAKRICHCDRSGMEFVADGQTKPVWEKGVVSCSESCTNFRGAVTCTAGQLSATNPAFLNYRFDDCRQEDCGCRVPLAGNSSVLVSNGGSTTLYKYNQNSAAVPDACTNPANRVTVTCIDKVLSAYDPAFQYASCTTRNLNCIYTAGDSSQVEVVHGNSLNISKNSRPACGETCENLRLFCNNLVFKVGSMSGATATPAQLAAHPSATACAPKNCDCNINGYSLGYNQTKDFYSVDKITNCNLNGCEEAKAALTCTANGVTKAGGGSPAPYIHHQCNVNRCGCAVPWGGTIEDGKTVRVHSLERAACDNPTACTDPANFRTLTCTNGTLSTYDSSQFRFPVCAPTVCECTWDTVKIPFGQTLRVFKNIVPPAGGTCAAISATATCQDGGAWTGADQNTFPFAACLDTPDAGQYGGTGNGQGNDEGPGSGIKRRIGLTDGGGSGDSAPCLSFATCRYENINVSIRSFPRKTCILPWGGGEVEFYSQIAAFSRQCVSGGEKCSSYRRVRMCHFPKWTESDAYKYPSCDEKVSCP